MSLAIVSVLPTPQLRTAAFLAVLRTEVTLKHATDVPATKPTRDHRKVIHATCALHLGPTGFANVVVSKRDETVVFDPHVDGACVLTLAEDEAVVLRDVLTRWLG